MQTIRGWLADNPGAAPDLMNENRSFIFFSELDIADPELGPLGAQGVPLTPGASLAVDRKFHALGVPMWLSGQAPTGPLGQDEAIRALFIAQDTGGAIRGPVRGDVFWGFGERAADVAGLMKHPGTLHALLPKPLAARALAR
jgi:membrane-bound lytic murein transglycosylase A